MKTDRNLSVIPMAALAAVSVASLPAQAAAGESEPGPEFTRLDRDGNGYLSPAEIRHVERSR